MKAHLWIVFHPSLAVLQDEDENNPCVSGRQLLHAEEDLGIQPKRVSWLSRDYLVYGAMCFHCQNPPLPFLPLTS